MWGSQVLQGFADAWHEAKRSSAKDLAICALAALGLGGLLVAPGFWLLQTANIGVDYMQEEGHGLDTRTGRDMGVMVLYWAVPGYILVACATLCWVLGLLCVAACAKRAVRGKRRPVP